MQKALLVPALMLMSSFAFASIAPTQAPAASTAPTVTAPASPAPAAKPMNKQQSKMATCNASAKGMKGDERKAFMKTCLSSSAPAANDKK